MTRLRVLVDDAEPSMLHLVASVLSIPGYEVPMAPSPTQALELVKANPCFDLVVSDIVMTEMREPELVRKTKEVCPNTAFVLMSGHTADEALPSEVEFISKPFLLPDLCSIVKQTLTHPAI